MKHQIVETVELLVWLLLGVLAGLVMVPSAGHIPGYEWAGTTSVKLVVVLVAAIIGSAVVFIVLLKYFDRLPLWLKYALAAIGVLMMLYGWAKLSILGMLLIVGKPAQPNIFAILLVAAGLALNIVLHANKLQRQVTTRVFNVIMLLCIGAIGAIIATKLTVWTALALLVVLAIYDAVAVWKIGTMQKMALAMLESGLPAGILVPKKKPYKIGKQKVDVALLGYGDVLILVAVGGALIPEFGFLPVIGMYLAVIWLFVYSKPGKFYPAIPYIAAGCFLGMLGGLLW